MSAKVFIDMNSAQKECDATAEGQKVPNRIPILIKFTIYGLQWILPKKANKGDADMAAMLKCLDPSKTASIPAEVFGPFRYPIDIKEMYFGKNGGNVCIEEILSNLQF